MGSSTNQQFQDASSKYNDAVNNYSGTQGYVNSLNLGGVGYNTMNNYASGGASTSSGIAQSNAKNQNAFVNDEAKKYAKDQAKSSSSGASQQARSNARNSGMSKAQAAMLGSQQGVNAYTSAYNSAYGNQLANAQNSYGTQLNNFGNQQNQYSGQQQQMAQQGSNQINALGQSMSAKQAEGQNEYNRTWGNLGAGIGMISSDERLKNYKELSTKVCYRSPSKHKELKWVKKETK